MPGAVTRTDFLAALRVLEPRLIAEYERARTRSAIRLVIDRALAAYRVQAKRLHPDQGGTHEAFIGLTRHREAVYRMRDALQHAPAHVAEFERAMRSASSALQINGVPVEVVATRHSFRHAF